MFRHKNTTVDASAADNKNKKIEVHSAADSDLKTVAVDHSKAVAESLPSATGAVKELLEKNLKWSQIIYEQNRKINNKLLWTAVAAWIKIFLIVVPLILIILFLVPFWQNLSVLKSQLLNSHTLNANQISPESLEQMLKLLPLNPLQQEQVKAIFK